MSNRPFSRVLTGLVALGVIAVSGNVLAQSARATDVRAARVIEHWTPERRAAAIPRDLVIDERGLGYLRMPGGALVPYGHNIAAQAAPGGSSDTTPPVISNLDPAEGATIGASHTFKAKVTDDVGVKSVSFSVQKAGSLSQTFSASRGADDVWSVTLSGFSTGSWSWSVTAKDGARGGGNTASAGPVAFTVGTGGGDTSGTITNSQWDGGVVVREAAGRIYFEMPSNRKLTRWVGYVCSGTVVNDDPSANGAAGDRSVILTAAHCVYDDVNKAFARNVMFIPDQGGTDGAGTDRNCGNDPLGCWETSLGVVDKNWTTRTFPDNKAWDYAYYVVKNSGSYTPGLNNAGEPLDLVVEPMGIIFSQPATGTATNAFTYALGYSYSDDPNFMYCAQNMTTIESVNWWLGSCGLSGGSSGGPWVQPMSKADGRGPVISVNSWGYTNQPGMAGPKLFGTSASLIFDVARCTPALSAANGDDGVIVDALNPPACP